MVEELYKLFCKKKRRKRILLGCLNCGSENIDSKVINDILRCCKNNLTITNKFITLLIDDVIFIYGMIYRKVADRIESIKLWIEKKVILDFLYAVT